jgi:hypothetical protein
MSRAPQISWSVVLVLASLVGCAEGRMSCRVGADCPSRVCMSDGTCASTRDAGPVDAPLAMTDASEEIDAAAADDTGMPTDGGGLVCAPDHDGVVTRAEVPLRAGLRANFRIAEHATVSTAGTTSGGARTWDYSGSYTGDHDELVELLAPGANWWAAEFPAATHAARVAASSDNLGVFQINDDALLLLGVVSPDGGATQTLLRYDPPVTVLAFPMAEGNTFTTTSNVTGTVLGVFGTYMEEYTSVVDASGTLVTPFGETAALRVRTEMVRTSGFATLTSQRQFTFVAECFGIAAIIVSDAFESDVEFTSAAEIRRLSP